MGRIEMVKRGPRGKKRMRRIEMVKRSIEKLEGLSV